jgi:phage-related minor tail protein
MSTILTHAIVQNVNGAVDNYVSTATGLYGELEGVINTLTANDFNGDAANGYREFFTSKVTPALTENLTAPSNSLTASIKSIMDTIGQQLLDTVDPQLGDNNRNPGGQ